MEQARMTTSHVNVRSGAARVIVAERPRIDDETWEASSFALKAISAFSAMFRPLSIDLVLACCDAETGYPLDEPAAPHRQLRQSRMLDPIRTWQSFEDTLVQVEPNLDQNTIRRWFVEVQRFDCLDPDLRPGWSSLVVNATEVRLPSSLEVESDAVTVSYGRGTFSHPAHPTPTGYRLATPLSTHPETNAFELSITHENHILFLELAMTWSFWADRDGAGRDDLAASLENLRESHWRVIS
jgi:hypothetical protein